MSFTTSEQGTAIGDARSWRAEFPALDQEVHGHPLTYLDSAATTQKPRAVLRAVERFYEHDNANVHRGVHTLSQRATEDFEESRRKIQRFIGAKHEQEILFTKGCTEAINLVAQSWGRSNLNEGDIVLLSTMEHHANIVPWQMVCAETGAQVIPIPITDSGEIDLDAYAELLKGPVKLVGVKHVCNALGTINPVGEMIRMAHDAGAKTMIDGAQALAHERVDVVALDADFYSMSGHKVYAPTGIGALYGKKALLDAMPPYQGGGDMIRTVAFEKTTYNELPNKFEAGTPNIAGSIGFGAALDFVSSLGHTPIQLHEHALLEYGTARLNEIPGVTIYGKARNKAAILSFTMDCAHPHDIGTILDQSGVAVRTGHHCCMPLMTRLGIPGTTRASLAVYNSKEDLNRLAEGLIHVREVFA